MKELINQFLEKYCTKIKEDETLDSVELMTDTHEYIKWENVEYYVPEENSLYSEDDKLILEFLINLRLAY